MSDFLDIAISSNLHELNDTFKRYANLYGDGRKAALLHAAHNFGVYGPRNMKEIAPAKGEITRENITRLKAKQGGIKISNRAKKLAAKNFGIQEHGGRMYMVGAAGRERGFTGKQKELLSGILSSKMGQRGVIQALMVAQELRLRESSKKFLAASLMFRGSKNGKTSFAVGRSGKQLGRGKHFEGSGTHADDQYFEFDWGSAISKTSAIAGGGLLTKKARAEISNAISDVRKDMLDYIEKAQHKAAVNAARSIR